MSMITLYKLLKIDVKKLVKLVIKKIETASV